MISNQIIQWIKESEILIITAGAGMAVDSGLPDFRGSQGFYTTYKAFSHKFSFTDCANPRFLKQHPYKFWGFYGHRLDVYQKTVPHQGFQILLDLCKNKKHFIITSNVDGQFQKAGFNENNIYEIHGTIHKFQCTSCNKLYDAKQYPPIEVNLDTFEAKDPLPKCDDCQELLRPNILMFGDGDWIQDISDQQEYRQNKFLSEIKEKPTTILEFGAGTAVPSIRYIGERLTENIKNCKLIRVNPRESDIKKGHKYHSIKSGALEFIKQLQ